MAGGFDAVQGSKLFQRLSAEPGVLVAVSGGADSMALMHLLARWSRTIPTFRLLVATVDHGLRPESADEARFVAGEAARLGLTHETLLWSEAKPVSGIQARARTARYDLLCDCARRHGIRVIATAHTLEDQAETVLMRLARGSGIDGLRGIAGENRRKGIAVWRPLLAISRQALRDWLAAEGLQWIEDPSNADLRFERIRIRSRLPELASLGLTPQQLALSARRLARAHAALEEVASKAAGVMVHWHHAGWAEIAAGPFAAEPAELRLRILAHVLAVVGGASVEPRLARLEKLLDVLGAVRQIGVTLQGCLIERAHSEAPIRVFREPGRCGLEALVLAAGACAIWDGRFAVSLGADAGQACLVRALSEADLALLKCEQSDVGAGIPRRAALTVPSFWRGDTLLAAPALGYRAPGVSARFLPLGAGTPQEPGC